MEIVFNKVNYQKSLKDINMSFKDGIIYGLNGKGCELVSNIFDGSINNYNGDIVSDTKIRLVVVSGLELSFYTNSVKEEFKFIAKTNRVKITNIRQAVIEMFYKLDIDESLYDRNISSLSRSERYLIKIILGMIINPNIVIFNNIFENLDLKYRKKLKMLLSSFKEDKIIIICDNDPNVLYDITEYLYILKNSSIALQGATDSIYTDVDKLIKLKIDIPYLSDVAYKAKKKKNIRLFYRKDVRDTMKDIYRNI